MATDSGLTPIPVGRLVAMEIDKRGWTQADLATVMGRPLQFVSEMINGHKELTRESAAQLSAALGVEEASFWLRFQNEYLLARQAADPKTQQALTDVRRRALMNEKVPLGLLRKRGVLHDGTLDELEAQVLELLELSSLEDDASFKVAARRSNRDEPITTTQMAWVACVRAQAKRQRQQGPEAAYVAEAAQDLAASLPAALTEANGFRHLPVRFAEVGISLVYVENFPGSRLDGCAFLLDGEPVIGLSGRGKRLDKVLWTLLHELAHVVEGHVDEEVLVEALDEHVDRDDTELCADERAERWLLPAPLPDPPARVNLPWVEAVAAERQLAPIVVVGQLQKDGRLDWKTTLARDAPAVTGAMQTWSD